ncbi:MAG: hypothetical protein J0H82_26080 [Alphaproteobacteria bacterium]|nr:hypothetical protein [Alphaproteobacteria bacterium]
MKPFDQGPAAILSPSDIKYRLDRNGRVAWALPENSVLVQEFEVRGGEAVLVRQRIDVVVTQPKSSNVDPSTGDNLIYAVGRREPFRFRSSDASSQAGEASDEER